MIARGLLTLSSIVFGATGLAYLVVPGLALNIVGIESSPTSDFLLRTEGVPLLFAAAVVWTLRHGGRREQRVILVALAGYSRRRVVDQEEPNRPLSLGGAIPLAPTNTQI